MDGQLFGICGVLGVGTDGSEWECRQPMGHGGRCRFQPLGLGDVIEDLEPLDPVALEEALRAAPHSHGSDPSTSRAAAARVNVTDQALRVLRVYQDGAELTDEAAYELAGLGRQSARRCSDLRRLGLIERVPGRKGRTASDRAATVSRITDAGRRQLASVPLPA